MILPWPNVAIPSNGETMDMDLFIPIEDRTDTLGDHLRSAPLPFSVTTSFVDAKNVFSQDSLIKHKLNGTSFSSVGGVGGSPLTTQKRSSNRGWRIVASRIGGVEFSSGTKSLLSGIESISAPTIAKAEVILFSEQPFEIQALTQRAKTRGGRWEKVAVVGRFDDVALDVGIQLVGIGDFEFAYAAVSLKGAN